MQPRCSLRSPLQGRDQATAALPTGGISYLYSVDLLGGAASVEVGAVGVRCWQLLRPWPEVARARVGTWSAATAQGTDEGGEARAGAGSQRGRRGRREIRQGHGAGHL